MREDVKEYARRILALPQPQRAQKGREFELKYHIKLRCAFDEDHPPSRPWDALIYDVWEEDPTLTNCPREKVAGPGDA